MGLRTVAVLLSLLSVTGCGQPPPAAPARRVQQEPSWPDVFEGAPDLYAVVRPRALKRDAIYGALWKSMMSAAEARGVMQGATMVEAVDGSEEVIVGLGGSVEGALVLRGVPANLDPERILDARGRPLFRPLTDRTRVVEYALVDAGHTDGSVFVLPDRTWVGALGETRSRARQVFATPLHRPTPEVEHDALATVRVTGALAHVLDRHPVFGPLSRRLSSATLSLMPGKSGVVLALAYPDADAAAWGENAAKTLTADLAKKDARLAFLKDASVRYEGTTVYVRVGIPPRLLEELPKASAADFFGDF
jgi:hypothetical protein